MFGVIKRFFAEHARKKTEAEEASAYNRWVKTKERRWVTVHEYDGFLLQKLQAKYINFGKQETWWRDYNDTYSSTEYRADQKMIDMITREETKVY